MDSILIDYLKSGKSWVLVGSGPSIEMGYPNWEQLASHAVKTAAIEGLGHDLKDLNAAFKRSDFPMVFDKAETILGEERLRQCLQNELKPKSLKSNIYELMAKWPILVYLTTNYDDEIQRHLSKIGEPYKEYNNSEEHLSYLVPDFKGAIVKLHGDLRSKSGLILTTKQYKAINQEENWEYWRTKMTSVFQMTRMVVIGHSLTDSNIKHVLSAAKKGTGVQLPICWIAPDVSTENIRKYLDEYRIRVIPYDNKDGRHANLLKLIEHVSDFVPSRTAVHINEQIKNVCQSPLGNTAAAPGFFIFNKLSLESDFEEKRIDVMLAAIQSILPKLRSMGDFTLEDALALLGWPKECDIDSIFLQRIREKAIEKKLINHNGNKFTVQDDSEIAARENRKNFEHIRERFRTSLGLRLKRDFAMLLDDDVVAITSDIEASLIGYFKEAGLSLATTLFSTEKSIKSSPIPTSIIKFITESSARYDDYLKRLAFCKIAVDVFVRAGSAERDYLGRISQGFFAFHQLGVFGDAANEKLKQIQSTVWLVDSSLQIPALALAAPTNEVFSQSINRLKKIGVRLFTTERLFDEVYHHLIFANNVIKNDGPSSPSVIAAATGQTPYRKSNLFLEGFIRWQDAGNPCNWHEYMYKIFESYNPTESDVRKAIEKIGIEVVPLQAWPGYSENDYAIVDECVEKITRKINETTMNYTVTESDQIIDPYKKARPEGEAFIIVKRERNGAYHILLEKEASSPSWFISSTSILNLIELGLIITWRPEAFLRFASTVVPGADEKSSDQAFEILLWGIAQSGLNIVDDEILERVFGGIIDQSVLDITEQHELFESTLGQKYGETSQAVLNRVQPIYRPLAALQIANEMAQVEAARRKDAEEIADKERKRANQAEQELNKLKKFRCKLEAKSRKGKLKAKKQKSKTLKKKR